MPDMGMEILIILAAVVILLLVMVMIRDSLRFVKVEYRIKSSKLKKSLSAVMLSDLHNKSYGKENEKLLKAIDEIKPDLILIAGDMFTANESKTNTAVAVKLLGTLAKNYPVYYALGNHEYRAKVYKEAYGSLYTEYLEAMEKCGVKMLDNERTYLAGINVEICGLSIERRYYRRLRTRVMEKEYVENLIGKSREDCFELLLAHNPQYFKEYVKWGADLTLAGHVHGGVIRLPYLGGMISPMMHLFPKYDGGLFEEGDKQMILGRGLGMHTIPVRIFNPGELVVIHFKAE